MFQFLHPTTRRRPTKKLTRRGAARLGRQFRVEALEQRLLLDATNIGGPDVVNFDDEGGLIELPTTFINSGATNLIIRNGVPAIRDSAGTYSASGLNVVEFEAIVGATFDDFSVVADGAGETGNWAGTLNSITLDPAEPALDSVQGQVLVDSAGAVVGVILGDDIVVNPRPVVGPDKAGGVSTSRPDAYEFDGNEIDSDDPFPVDATSEPPRVLTSMNLPKFPAPAARQGVVNFAQLENEGLIDVAAVLHDGPFEQPAIVEAVAQVDENTGSDLSSEANPDVALRPANRVFVNASPQPAAAVELNGTRGRSQAFELAMVPLPASLNVGAIQSGVPASFDVSVAGGGSEIPRHDGRIATVAVRRVDPPVRLTGSGSAPVDDARLAGLPLAAVDAAFKQIGAASESWFVNVGDKNTFPLAVALVTMTGFLVVRTACGVPDGRDRLAPKPRPLNWASA